jgi:NAD(P)H-dependent FMN reductase
MIQLDLPAWKNLVCVVGSAARSHRTRQAIEAVAAGASATDADVNVEIIDLSQRHVSVMDGRSPEEYGDDTGGVISAIQRAGCVILSTPIYRGTYTGALKNLLDHLPLEALEGKAVGLLASGATDHHMLAIDHQLRGVLAWFNAYLVPGSVYVTHRDSIDGGFEPGMASRLAQLGQSTVGLARVLPAGPPLPFALARAAKKS